MALENPPDFSPEVLTPSRRIHPNQLAKRMSSSEMISAIALHVLHWKENQPNSNFVGLLLFGPSRKRNAVACSQSVQRNAQRVARSLMRARLEPILGSVAVRTKAVRGLSIASSVFGGNLVFHGFSIRNQEENRKKRGMLGPKSKDTPMCALGKLFGPVSRMSAGVGNGQSIVEFPPLCGDPGNSAIPDELVREAMILAFRFADARRNASRWWRVLSQPGTSSAQGQRHLWRRAARLVVPGGAAESIPKFLSPCQLRVLRENL